MSLRPSPFLRNFLLTICLGAVSLSACTLTAPKDDPWLPPAAARPESTPSETRRPALSPTPNPGRVLPTLRAEEAFYTVQAGDTLNQIARTYGLPLKLLAEANQIENPDLLEVGQELRIPPPTPGPIGPDFIILPDSELVFSPGSLSFNLNQFVQSSGGYLSRYQETVSDQTLTGTEIVDRISREYSVNPRLLLALIEHQSGWVTQPQPKKGQEEIPIAVLEPWRTGLYRQLAWAANQLNRGYYLWKVNAVAAWFLPDSQIVPPDPRLNAATAGVQNLFSALYDRPAWERAVGPQGLQAAYTRLFGSPFAYTLDNYLPADLQQPDLRLPFASGETWSFTGGPHGGWGDGSAWAALDFAPPDGGRGCASSQAWVTAVAGGKIVRSAEGMVVLDLDGDGLEQTGWSILYLHIAAQGRIKAGAVVKSGDRIGRPSCEGGQSNGTHVHLARRYNGEWIPADGEIPFIMDGWVSVGSGNEYDGTLIREGVVVEAWDSVRPENQIQR